MPASTYEPLGSVKLTTAQTSVTFTNIPQNYTDLVLVANAKGTGVAYLTFRFNGDSSTSYSDTFLYGLSNVAYSGRDTSVTQIYGAAAGASMNAVWTNGNYSIQNYNNNSTFKTVLGRFSAAGNETTSVVGLWRNTAAITSITVLTTSNSYDVGSTFSLYGVTANTLKATGGDIIATDGTYWYHAFKTSGTFAPASGTSLTCDVITVAGGGGLKDYIGGGGGAGGLVYSASNSISSAQTVTVGAGGSTGNGSNSQFGSLTAAVGGGAGGNYNAITGNSGGSGGGGGSGGPGGTNGAPIAGGSATSGQGNAGGAGVNNTGGVYTGGGGGGAGAAGANAVLSTSAGAGGAGVNTYSGWLAALGLGVGGYLAGGGGGAADSGGTSGAGGLGGGGYGGASRGSTGASPNGTSGVANTGGGAGGFSVFGTRQQGGSGVVIVRYAV